MEPWHQYEYLGFWGKKIRKDRIAIGIAQRIIKEGVSNQMAFNIMDLKNLKEMWDKLKEHLH